MDVVKSLRIERCETCRWYAAQSEANGACHFHPPTPFPVVVRTLQGEQTAYGGVNPAVNANNFCASHKPVDFNG